MTHKQCQVNVLIPRCRIADFEIRIPINFWKELMKIIGYWNLKSQSQNLSHVTLIYQWVFSINISILILFAKWQTNPSCKILPPPWKKLTKRVKSSAFVTLITSQAADNNFLDTNWLPEDFFCLHFRLSFFCSSAFHRWCGLHGTSKETTTLQGRKLETCLFKIRKT